MSSIVRSMDTVEGGVDLGSLGVRADDQCLGAVAIDVVGTGLSVILDNEYRGVLPELRVRQLVDQTSDGEVVVGDHGFGGGGAGGGAPGVVRGQPHELHGGHPAGVLEVLESLGVGIHPGLVGDRQVVPRVCQVGLGGRLGAVAATGV